MSKWLTTAALIAAVSASCSSDDSDGAMSIQPSGAGDPATSCLPTQQWCDGGCVDVSSNALHCGTCGQACLPGQLCTGGACSTSCAGSVCPGASGPECVSLSSDHNHCGACNAACAPTDSCVDGRCVLDCGALTACDGACTDVLSDDAHCGGCDTACTGGTSCVQGTCSCPDGFESCGGGCVDIALDPLHCGGCDQACGGQDVCEAGRCVGPDGCSDTLAAGLTLSAVDIYQTVQIPIMEQGAAVAGAMRNADVVAGRRAVFRVHVVPEAEWTPREVSARVELTTGATGAPGATEIFFARLSPARASTDADPDSTFQVLVPAEAIGADTRYAVTLVECEQAPPAPSAMAAARARFPSTGHEPLEARETGPLEVHIVPIGNPGPDVSEQALRAFKERLEAVYPITEVRFTVGEPLQSTATSMCAVLGSVSSRRSQDAPPPNVYYYGLTRGILGGQSGCSNASASPSGSKVSAGWAQGTRPDDGTTGAATMCHELGHAHGRLHAPCNVQDPDRQYPYPGADIGVWAYDFRSGEFYEPTRKDMMSYCPEPRWAAWISDYNYQAILQRVVAVNALAETPALYEERGTPQVPWRLLVSDSAGVHWVEEPLLVRGAPEGTPVSAIIHGAQGPMLQVQVYERPLHDGVSHDAFMLTVPQPDDTWRAIEVPGRLAPQAFPWFEP